MTLGMFPPDELAFQAMRDIVGSNVALDVRFPNWPFRDAHGYTVIFEYDRVLGGGFGEVLAELADAHGDEAVTAVGVDPSPSIYREGGFFPAFSVPGGSIRTGYNDAMWFEPGVDVVYCLAITLNMIAITGSSGAWAVFARRDWEIGLLLTPEPTGPWLDTSVAWFDRDIDLDEIRSPAGWGMPLSDADREEFARQIRERGSGP